MTKEIIGIFGGSGFVGLELVSLLCKSGYKIKIFRHIPIWGFSLPSKMMDCTFCIIKQKFYDNCVLEEKFVELTSIAEKS